VTEYRRRLDAERGHLVQRDKLRSIQIQQKLLDPPSRTLAVADPKLVYVKAEQGGIGSREGNAWQWTIYLPPDKRDWWLYISQGSKWDAVQGKYVDGAISGSQFKTGREQSLWGCISYDREGGAYIQIWSADGCQTARMSDAGYATFRGSPDAARITAGETEQEALSPATSPRGRMQLFRWHRVSADATSEYGFSIYLVDESPPGR
jgi:hypothetical protein